MRLVAVGPCRGDLGPPGGGRSARARDRRARLHARARVVSYPVTGALEGLTFDLGDGDIVIVGGGRRDGVEVQRTERYAFGHRARDRAHASTAGVFGVQLALPDLAARARARVGYRVIVPDNVARRHPHQRRAT